MSSEQIRPTKKQRELLNFVQVFINQHGYGPSYREIMKGAGYSSPATVALHVNNLVARGHLRKKTKSARSLEVVGEEKPAKVTTNSVGEAEEKWLVEHIKHRFAQSESGQPTRDDLDNLYVLVGALKVLGFDQAASLFSRDLSDLKSRL